MNDDIIPGATMINWKSKSCHEKFLIRLEAFHDLICHNMDMHMPTCANKRLCTSGRFTPCSRTYALLWHRRTAFHPSIHLGRKKEIEERRVKMQEYENRFGSSPISFSALL
jgi:hypothetical protein